MDKLIFAAFILLICVSLWIDNHNQQQKQSFNNQIHYYHKQAKNGDLNAQKTLATLYARGVDLILTNTYGVNLQNANYWYEQSALQGDMEAQYHLANNYENGMGLAVDLQNANYWYYQSAMQGNSLSQYKLAKIFENGRGVPRSYQDAMYWYIKLAEQGHKQAIYQVGIVYDDGLWGFNENDELALFWLDKLDPNDKDNPFDLRSRLLTLKIDSIQIPQQQYLSKSDKNYSSEYYGHSSQCTAICWDGTCSKSLGRRGVCSRHGGVKYWINH